jgi:para-nitrobenzyl esterase
MYTPELAAATTERVLQALNLTSQEWRKLLDLPAAELLRIQSTFAPVPPHQKKRNASGITEPAVGGFGPVVDGRILPHHPFDPTAPAISKDKPLLTGWNVVGATV